MARGTEPGPPSAGGVVVNPSAGVHGIGEDRAFLSWCIPLGLLLAGIKVQTVGGCELLRQGPIAPWAPRERCRLPGPRVESVGTPNRSDSSPQPHEPAPSALACRQGVSSHPDSVALQRPRALSLTDLEGSRGRQCPGAFMGTSLERGPQGRGWRSPSLVAEPEEPLLPPVTPLHAYPRGPLRTSPLGLAGAQAPPHPAHTREAGPARARHQRACGRGGWHRCPFLMARGDFPLPAQDQALTPFPRGVLSRPTRHPQLPASSAQHPSSPLGDPGRETRSPIVSSRPQASKNCPQALWTRRGSRSRLSCPHPAPAWGRQHRTPALGTDPESQLPASSATTSRSPAPAPSRAKHGRLPHGQSRHPTSPPRSGSR